MPFIYPFFDFLYEKTTDNYLSLVKPITLYIIHFSKSQ